jgi:hypothetical protein
LNKFLYFLYYQITIHTFSTSKGQNLQKKKLVIITITIVVIGSTVGILGFLFLPTLLDSAGPIPQFVENDWIDLEYITSISKFHSTIGHGYPEEDHPTSDKHYFNPFIAYGSTNDTIKVYSPVRTRVIKIEWEQHILSDGTIRGQQIHLQSIEHPSITFIYFHINIEPTGLSLNQELAPGQWIGYCDCREGCNTDIAIYRSNHVISWFQVISDALLSNYQARGISNRSMMIKSEEEIAYSTSLGYDFGNSDPSDWVNLSII